MKILVNAYVGMSRGNPARFLCQVYRGQNKFNYDAAAKASEKKEATGNIEAKEVDTAKAITSTQTDLLKVQVEAKERTSSNVGELEVQNYIIEPLKKDVHEILNDKNKTPEEIFQAMHNYAEAPATQHKFKEHMKLMPNDWQNNAKIGGILATIGFIGHEGTPMESTKKALKWGLWAAALTHPVVTSGLAHLGRGAGKNVVAPLLIGGTNLIFNAVDNPKQLFESFIDSFKGDKYKDPFNTPIAKLLRHNTTVEAELGEALSISQDPFYLKENGMEFAPKIGGLIDFMENYDPSKPSGNILMHTKNAAEFVAQTNSIMLSEAEIQSYRNKLWNKKENIPGDIRRQIIATNIRTEIDAFFNKNADLKMAFDMEVKNQIELTQIDGDGKLPTLAAKDLKSLIGVNQDFTKLDKRLPHGVSRLLKNPTGGAMIFYLLVFFLTKGAMAGKKLFQADTYKKAFSKDNVKKRAGQVAKIAFLPFTGLWKGAKWITGNSDSRRARKEVAKWGKAGVFGSKWDSKKMAAWKAMPKKERTAVAKKLGKMVNEKEAALKVKIAELKKKHGKAPWWPSVTKQADNKGYASVPEYVEARKQLKNIKLNVTPAEGEGLFSSISVKAKEILFPKT